MVQRARQTTVCQVGQDAQVDASAGDGFDARGEALAGGVDRVGAHRVAHIIDQVNDQERANGGVINDSNFEITRAAAKFSQDGVDGIGLGKQVRFVFVDFQARRFDVIKVNHLYLADHFGR